MEWALTPLSPWHAHLYHHGMLTKELCTGTWLCPPSVKLSLSSTPKKFARIHVAPKSTVKPQLSRYRVLLEMALLRAEFEAKRSHKNATAPVPAIETMRNVAVKTKMPNGGRLVKNATPTRPMGQHIPCNTPNKAPRMSPWEKYQLLLRSDFVGSVSSLIEPGSKGAFSMSSFSFISNAA